MNVNEIGVGIYAINNKSMPGLDYFYGQPFLAKDDDDALEHVNEAIKDKLDLINLDNFQLVRLGLYNCALECPIISQEQVYYNLKDFFMSEKELADE